ncbi:MAG TPA: MltA domain-containing protein [Rhizomicrobium sp.]|jgi:membrane-bound lytic murein transglycosylase A
MSALAAFRRSCTVLLHHPATQTMGGTGYAGRVGDWRDVCADSLRVSPGAAAARAWFESRFAVFGLHAGGGTAFFTGYYEPEIRASRVPHGNFTTPIYGLPRDLVSVDLALFRNNFPAVRLEGRLVGNRLVPYAARAEIDAKGLNDAPVLLYAADPISVFFLHIQGSGRALLDDGSMLRLAYAGQNGRPYTPIGRTLIEERALDRQHLSMQAIRDWLQRNPARAREIMESDQSFVFFRELPIGDPALGSPGSEGVPLTPEASLAVDSSIHPFAVPMFIATTAPGPNLSEPDRRFARLLIAQDTGGAIKGPLRADIFWGFGADAESVAGRMKSQGTFFVLLPKSLAAHLPRRYLETS